LSVKTLPISRIEPLHNLFHPNLIAPAAPPWTSHVFIIIVYFINKSYLSVRPTLEIIQISI
jgi:hypothetical protein